MKIKDVEKQVGISKANIRFYEEEGLIHPARNQENNYREYSEADVEQLQEIKKLRLIGIPVQEIKEIYEDRLTLQEALSRRLDEIEKEERTLKETKLTCQKALKSKLDITSIDQLEIEEEKEEWQVRLAILLKEDIVQKKLSRDEMNNEIACFFIAGTILSVISIWLLPKDYIGTHLYVGLISLAAVVGLLIIGTCSANMKVHLTLLLLGAVVQPVGLFTIGTVMGRGYIVCRDTAVLKQYVIYLYGGGIYSCNYIVDGLKAEPLYSEQTLDQYACKPDHGRSDSTDAESEVWTLDGNRRTYRGIFVCCYLSCCCIRNMDTGECRLGKI